MPFKSEAQRGWMYANHPEMAKEWEAHTAKGKKLPKKKGTHSGGTHSGKAQRPPGTGLGGSDPNRSQRNW